jgi:hypothetical protein
MEMDFVPFKNIFLNVKVFDGHRSLKPETPTGV